MKHYKGRAPTTKNENALPGITRNIRQEGRGKGRVTRLRINVLIALPFGIYLQATTSKLQMIPYVACPASREFHCHPYRQHVSHLQTHIFS